MYAVTILFALYQCRKNYNGEYPKYERNQENGESGSIKLAWGKCVLDAKISVSA